MFGTGKLEIIVLDTEQLNLLQEDIQTVLEPVG
jgi:hypothetical protein